MAGTIYLIDAMAFAFRAYYAIRATLTDDKGRPTNAVYGFTRVLLKILREHEPSHVAVVFDPPGKTFRDEMYAEYKATRRETPPDLKEQFPMIQELVETLKIPSFCVAGFEADDVMGTLARAAEAQGMDAVLVTGDKDMLQLVTDRICVFDPSKDEKGLWIRSAEVADRFGTDPAHVIDALALIGDAADNVPGVRGIGDKTAKKLMEQYGSLESLYGHIDELKGKQKDRLIEDKESAFFSRTLVTIKTDVPLDQKVQDLLRGAADPEAAIAMLESLGFHSIIDELFPQKANAGDHLEYSCLLTEREILDVIAALRAAGEFAVDTETTSVDPMQADLVGISLCAEEGRAYYIPVGHSPESLTFFDDPDDLSTARRLEPLPKEQALALLRPLFADPDIGKMGHNIKYDAILLERAGVPLSGIVLDTMVASYLTDPSRLRHNLDEVSLQYLRRKLTPISELIGSGSKSITFDHVPIRPACEYACQDADVTWRLASILRSHLRDRQLETLNSEVELPLIAVLARMEMVGIALDLEVFDTLQSEIQVRLESLVREIFELAGESFTINSPKQLQVILFDKLGLKPTRKTKTGYSTDVDVLEELSGEHPLPAKILEYRTLEKLRGTYVETLPRLLNPTTGRLHTSYNQAVAATGRLSSSNPNLQNIPVRTDIGKRIREGFIAGTKEQRLISADYSQIELRILAHLTGDKVLRQAFFDDADIHRETAARVFGVTPEEVTDRMRSEAKAVNFGVIYGMSAFGLARNLKISKAEAQRFIDAYFALYPEIRAWLDATVAQARERGYVTTLLQRRRYLPELKSSDINARRGAERMAINTPVQGSAADIIKLAMLRLDAALDPSEARLLLQVHDELVVEADHGIAAKVADQMKNIMESAVKLDVPLKVDSGIGNNWAEIH